MLAAVAGGIAFGALKLDISSKRSDLMEAQLNQQAAQKSLQEKLAALTEAKAKLAALQGAVDADRTLSREIKTLQGERKALQEKFVELVMEVRAKSAGTAFPDLALSGGRTLQAATIQKVTNMEVTVSHTGGVTRVPLKDVPLEIRQKYRMDMPPMTVEDQPLQSVADVTRPLNAAAPTGQMPPGGAAAPAAKGNPDHIRIDIENLTDKIKALEKNRHGWSERAASLRSQVADIQANGKPTYNVYQEIKQAERSMVAIDQQVALIQSQIVVLRKRLADALAYPK